MPDHTQWLNSPSDSNDDAQFGELYAELKQIAVGRMAMERQGQTLNATALVHEAWLRLKKSTPEQWRDRKQFYAAAAEAMRRILVEAARRRLAVKRGSGGINIPLEGLEVAAPVTDDRLLGIHEVLDELEAEDELKAQIVKLRFFSGMNHTEIAALLDMSEKTVRRHWALAKVWLYRALEGNP
ncbi:MAG: ECF-type sigma factor [Verrucomicrobiota bacterium]